MENNKEVLIEPNGEVRSVHTLELLGHWFNVDNVKYFMPLKIITMKKLILLALLLSSALVQAQYRFDYQSVYLNCIDCRTPVEPTDEVSFEFSKEDRTIQVIVGVDTTLYKVKAISNRITKKSKKYKFTCITEDQEVELELVIFTNRTKYYSQIHFFFPREAPYYYDVEERSDTFAKN